MRYLMLLQVRVLTHKVIIRHFSATFKMAGAHSATYPPLEIGGKHPLKGVQRSDLARHTLLNALGFKLVVELKKLEGDPNNPKLTVTEPGVGYQEGRKPGLSNLYAEVKFATLYSLGK